MEHHAQALARFVSARSNSVSATAAFHTIPFQAAPIAPSSPEAGNRGTSSLADPRPPALAATA
jgi:hypothetical protein